MADLGTLAMNCQSQIVDVVDHFSQSYQTWNEAYDPANSEGHVLRVRLQRALSLVRRHAPPAGRALDLGCGCGPASHALAGLGYQVTGLDVAPTMIEQAAREAARRGVAERCRFECGDISAMDLPNGGFEVIVALGFIEYFDQPAPMLQRMREWLSPTGILVLQMTNRVRLTRLLEGKRGLRVQRNGAGLLSYQYSPAEMTAMARECGLCRVDYRGHSIGPIKLMGRFIPGYRAAMWLDRRLDAIADTRLGRRLGCLGTSFISVFRGE